MREFFRDAAGAVQRAIQPDRSRSYANKVSNIVLGVFADATVIVLGANAIRKFLGSFKNNN